jgi:hypothetical protein
MLRFAKESNIILPVDDLLGEGSIFTLAALRANLQMIDGPARSDCPPIPTGLVSFIAFAKGSPFSFVRIQALSSRLPGKKWLRTPTKVSRVFESNFDVGR